MQDNAVVEVHGLHGIELDELAELVPPSAVESVAKEERGASHYGEPVLVTIGLIATSAAVHALAAWLSRRAARNQVGQGFTIVVQPDRTIRIELANVAAAGQPAQPSTAAEIAKSIADAISAAA